MNETSLTPGDAVAAIIRIGDRFLLQHRDDKPDIWFPDHWGCFGGNVEVGEDGREALARELSEEVHLSVRPDDCVFFTRFEFDFGFAGCPQIYRIFYELSLPEGAEPGLRLGEGQGMGVFDAARLTDGSVRLTPYDSFALWMYLSRARISPQTAR